MTDEQTPMFITDVGVLNKVYRAAKLYTIQRDRKYLRQLRQAVEEAEKHDLGALNYVLGEARAYLIDPENNSVEPLSRAVEQVTR